MSKETSGANPVKDLSYKSAVGELEAIVNRLDQGEVDVDTLSEQFQRAIDIVEELDARITKTKTQVERLAPRLDAIGSAQPKEPEDERY